MTPTREAMLEHLRTYLEEERGLPPARVTEDDRAIKVETDKLEAVIPKKNPTQWMTGIGKGSLPTVK